MAAHLVECVAPSLTVSKIYKNSRPFVCDCVVKSTASLLDEEIKRGICMSKHCFPPLFFSRGILN